MPAQNDTWRSPDLLIYGATPAGIIATHAFIQLTAGTSRKVIVMTQDNHIGGMMTSGLSATDRWTDAHIQGVVRDFFVRVARQYDATATEPMWIAEPHKYRAAFIQLLTNPRVQFHQDVRIVAVNKSGPHIQSIHTVDVGDPDGPQTRYTARQFIDATYELDMGRLAGVSYRIGREDADEHGESYAGYFDKKQRDGVSPYDGNGQLSPFVEAWDGSADGDGDHRVQSANFRLCLTDRPSNRLDWPEPDNYDPSKFELYDRLAEKYAGLGSEENIDPVTGTIRSPYYTLVPLPNGKWDMNGGSIYSMELPAGLHNWTEATPDERAAIYETHKQHTLEFIKWVRTSPLVPQTAKDRINSLGLCADEFPATGGWPPLLYVRESARLDGRVTLDQNHVTSLSDHYDSIGTGYYPFDAKLFRLMANPAGDGLIYDGAKYESAPRFEIPYRSLTPKENEADNLTVAVCISCTNVVWGSFRMEPYLMACGVACATASWLAVMANTTVQQISVTDLRRTLRDDLGQQIDR